MKKPSITLSQWLHADPRGRRVRICAEGDETRAILLGESLAWRGAGQDETEAINRALLAREKLHGAAL